MSQSATTERKKFKQKLASEWNLYGLGNPVRNIDPSGHANIDTAGFTAGYVETIAPLIDVYDTPARIFDKAGRWVEKHPNYDPSADPNLAPSQKAAASAVYHEYHRTAGNDVLATYHYARQYGMDDPDFSAELVGDMLDNGFGNSFGGPPILFGPVKKQPAITMDEALDRAGDFLDAGTPIRAADSSPGVQFIQEFTDSAGNRVTRRVGFDVDPASSHVQSSGPHLNLQTQINGRPVRRGPNADPHIPIVPSSIRRGDY